MQRKVVAGSVVFAARSGGERVTVTSEGIRCQLRIGRETTSCNIFATTDIPFFEPGVEYEILIELLLWMDADPLPIEDPLELYVGSRLVGRGHFGL